MVLDWKVLTLSQEKVPGLFIVDSGLHPPRILDVVLNFIRLVSRSGDHEKKILEVIS